MMRGLICLVIFIGNWDVGSLMAQSQTFELDRPQTSKTTIADTIDPGYILMDADKSYFIQTDDTLWQFLIGNFKAVQDSTFFFADSAEFFNSILYARSNVIILQKDTIQIFADSVRYDGDSLEAILYSDVTLLNGDQKLFTNKLIYKTDIKVAYYYDTALLVQDNAELRSLKGVFDIDNKVADFYEHVSVVQPDFLLRSDSLRYFMDSKKTVFKSATRIRQGDSEIYCRGGFYDLDDSLGVFYHQAQYRDSAKTVEADTILYDGKNGIVTLIGQANYVSDGEVATADKMVYNETTGDVLLTGNAKYRGPDNKAFGDVIKFNEKTEAFDASGSSVIYDGPNILRAENIYKDQVTSERVAEGKVLWQDTVERAAIQATTLRYNADNEVFVAVGDSVSGDRPIFVQGGEGDSIYIVSDTLRSTVTYLEDSSGQVLDTVSQVIADNQVVIYKSDMQAVADSLVYDRVDSVFTLMQKPIMWSDSMQFNSDTIKLFQKNEKVEKIIFINNAMIISTRDEYYFDQIKGEKITAFFENGKLDSMIVRGSAECIYHLLDKEEAYMGVNKTACSYITFSFKDGELQDIRFYVEKDSQIYPMKEADSPELKLAGFRWMQSLKPRPVRLTYYTVENLNQSAIDKLRIE